MKMQEYELSFTLESEFSVKINAENFEQAKELVHDSPTPATCIVDAEGGECEPDWHQSYVGRIEDLEVTYSNPVEEQK